MLTHVRGSFLELRMNYEDDEIDYGDDDRGSADVGHDDECDEYDATCAMWDTGTAVRLASVVSSLSHAGFSVEEDAATKQLCVIAGSYESPDVIVSDTTKLIWRYVLAGQGSIANIVSHFARMASEEQQ
jgi:hypothetical protein